VSCLGFSVVGLFGVDYEKGLLVFMFVFFLSERGRRKGGGGGGVIFFSTKTQNILLAFNGWLSIQRIFNAKV